MKNVIAIFVLTAFAVSAYAGNSNPDEALFAEGTCYEQNGYCELTDFRGQTHEYEFADLGKNVDVYSGPQTNGVSCSGPICTNAQNQVIGLNPAYKDPYAGSSQQPQTTTQQPVQQASEPPYYFKDEVMKTGGYDYNPVFTQYILLISKVNGLVIKRFVINDGSGLCTNYKGGIIPPSLGTLDMGRSFNIIKRADCNVVKIEVETNMGSWVHTR